jgi:hypothetical protein
MITLGRVTAQIAENHVTAAAIRALDRPLEMSWKQKVEIRIVHIIQGYGFISLRLVSNAWLLIM